MDATDGSAILVGVPKSDNLTGHGVDATFPGLDPSVHRIAERPDQAVRDAIRAVFLVDAQSARGSAEKDVPSPRRRGIDCEA